MLTLNATLLDEILRAGHALDLVIHCVIVGNTRADPAVTRTITVCKGSKPYCQNPSAAEEDKVFVPNLLASVGAAAYEVDPIKRSATVGQVSLEITDTGAGSEIRAWLAACYANGAKCTITWGAQGVPLTAFAPFGVYYLTDFDVTPGMVTLETRDGSWIVEGKKFAGLWVSEHPAECALKNLEWCGIPSALIDSASFAFDVFSPRSHYNIKRVGVRLQGGVGKSATAYGAYATGFSGWIIDGATHLTTDANGKIYPELIVDGVSWQLNIYDGTGSDRLLVGQAETRVTVDWAGGALDMVIGPPYALVLPVGGVLVGSALGKVLTGGQVTIDTDVVTSSIALNSSNYVIPVCWQAGKDEAIKDVLDELCFLSGASIHIREDGKLEWKNHYATADADRTWTSSEITTLSVKEAQNNIINKIIMTMKHTVLSYQNTADLDKELTANRAGSQAAHSYDGGTTSRVCEESYDVSMCDANAVLQATITDSATSFNVGRIQGDLYWWGGYVENPGMCVAISAAEGRQADSTKYRYLYLLFDTPGHQEIVRVGTTVRSGAAHASTIVDPQSGESRTLYNDCTIECSDSTRGFFGTTGYAHGKDTRVFDITMAFETSERILDRFEDGAPVLLVETGLSEYAVQVGDTVCVDDDLAASFGITSTTKMEVIGKEADLCGSPPCIKWTLCRMASTATTHTGSYQDRWGHRDFRGAKRLDLTPADAGSITFVGDKGIMHVDKSNLHWDVDNARLGIGTTSPSSRVHIRESAVTLDGGVSIRAGAQLIVEENDHCEINIITPSNKHAGFFGFGADGDFSGFSLQQDIDRVATYVKSTDLMHVEATGGIEFKDTGATIATPASDWIVMWADGAAVKFKDSGGKTATITLS